MSDKLRMLKMLEEAGTRGVHTHDFRKLGVSGNPSERRRELIDDGYPVIAVKEWRGKRPGSRYTLQSGRPVEHVSPSPDSSGPVVTVICDARVNPPKWTGLGAT